MTELANWVAGAPTPMPGNYNALGGFGFNPYDPRRDPRDRRRSTAGRSWRPAGRAPASARPRICGPATSAPRRRARSSARRTRRCSSGSSRRSAGSAATASSRSSPTRTRRVRWQVGHRRGDSAGGPRRTIARSARPGDEPLHAAAEPRLHALPCVPEGLKGARIGIPRAFYYEPLAANRLPRGGLPPEPSAAMTEAIAILRAQGAVVVDPADIPSIVDPDPANNFLAWSIVFGRAGEARFGPRLFGGPEVRHEARLQRLAGVARTDGAGQVADRAAAVE